MHCKAKNFKNGPSPLCFPFCFSSLPTDAWGTTSPDFSVENWVHLAINPSCPLPPTWMWSWESMFSHQTPLWQWGEGAPSPLGLSAAHTPQVWSWHTPPGQGGGGVDPLPTDRGQMFQTWPQQVSKVFSFRKQPEPLPHSLRMLVDPSLEIWVHLLHSIDPLTFVLFPDFQANIGPNFKWLWKFRHSGFCKWFNWMAGNAQVSRNT